MSELLHVNVLFTSYMISEKQTFNLILPITFFFEKDSLVYNIYGYLNKLKFIYAPVVKAKDVSVVYNLIYNVYLSFFFISYVKKYFRYILKKYFIWVDYFVSNFFDQKQIYNIYVLQNLVFMNEKISNVENLLIFFNSEYLYNVNNFFYINIYTKLSKNLSFGYLSFKNKPYMYM